MRKAQLFSHSSTHADTDAGLFFSLETPGAKKVHPLLDSHKICCYHHQYFLFCYVGMCSPLDPRAFCLHIFPESCLPHFLLSFKAQLRYNCQNVFPWPLYKMEHLSRLPPGSSALLILMPFSSSRFILQLLCLLIPFRQNNHVAKSQNQILHCCV